MNISSYVYTALVAVVLLVGYFMYSLYQDNVTLKENEVKYLISIDEQNKSIKKLNDSIIEKDEINSSNTKIIESNKLEKEELIKKFNKEKKVTVIVDGKDVEVVKQRDLNKLANAKPKMVQNIINKGTIKEFDCLSQLTDPNLDVTTLGECK